MKHDRRKLTLQHYFGVHDAFLGTHNTTRFANKTLNVRMRTFDHRHPFLHLSFANVLVEKLVVSLCNVEILCTLPEVPSR